ncbi:hypothetical protein EJ08DRAFT_651880 [Tothia fuscella]|uniref:VWFA domain-containing protein n=1 Tax=Tothia fuscella TaxID=1048955 RepID=A0A9P4NL60_9PEZI|nr:hypothetical protein EJ08DRAFT_651880 [Tothia fuscella]
MVRYLDLAVLTTTALLSPVLGSLYARNSLVRRADVPAACQALQINGGNGGRKIGIVIDSSGSNADTDPNDIRVVAAKNLNDALISSAKATADKKADLVTVVDFDSYAVVLYPLGDPSGANAQIDTINSSGGTAIYDGVAKAIDELAKGSNVPTANLTGIVVLTDGQDGSTTALIREINRAGSLGIRVSFGFLDPSSSSAAAPNVLAAILKTGGIYSTISSASAQQSFVNLVFSNGITGSDAGSSVSNVLLPGIASAQFQSGSGSNTFTYSAQSGEALNFTIQALSSQTLDAVLKDKAAGTELNKTKTGTGGTGFMAYNVQQATELELVVTSGSTNASALFSVGMNSSLGVVNCSLPGSTPTNTTGGNGTLTPGSHTSPPPMQYTGGADVIGAGLLSLLGGAAFAVLL